jgi:hypothetical protein
MTYYSHHRKMGPPHHVQVEVHSANSVEEENKNIRIKSIPIGTVMSFRARCK